MSELIELRPEHAEIVRAILHRTAPRGSRVSVFGSRATGRARPKSDLDLAIDCGRPIGFAELGEMNEAFDEAPVPWSVDLVDLQAITGEFRSAIEGQLVPFLTVD